jgi:hypothetical protein
MGGDIGFGCLYVLNERCAAFCCLECRMSVFQQLNGRNVGAGVAIMCGGMGDIDV